MPSPWADMSRTPTSVEAHRNYHTDYITSNLVAWSLRASVPPSLSVSDPYFSPMKHPFATKAKLFIQVGTAEVLADDVTELAKAMGDVPGNDVMLWEVRNAMHDVFAAGAGLGFEKEAREAVHAAGGCLTAPGSA
ncbi:hypothetical protein MMC17_007407 [Xylographa soralifera]|nr:hypothetical protein [Xylographa soralifera]